jgi:hypothetical protein
MVAVNIKRKVITMILSYKKIYNKIFLLVLLCSSCDMLNIADNQAGNNISNNKYTVKEINYKFKLKQNQNNQTCLDIQIKFIMPANQIYLDLPNNYIKKTKLFNLIDNLHLEGPGKISDDKQEARKLIIATAGQEISIRYELHSYIPANNKKDASFKDASFDAPTIRENFIYFVGRMALVYPIFSNNDALINITMQWDTPFEIYSSFAVGKIQRFKAKISSLWQALYTGGDEIKTREIIVRHKPVIITFMGKWKNITHDELAHFVKTILTVQRAALNDDRFPYFLVNFWALAKTVRQGDEEIRSIAGTALSNSLTVFFHPEQEFNMSVKNLISHELTHMWLGSKILFGKKDGIDGKWLWEGWTDYFAEIFAYRAKEVSLKDYFTSVNHMLSEYQQSSENHTKLEQVVQRYFKKGLHTKDLFQLPYQQGQIMAMRLNHEIKIRSNFKFSFDNVLSDMLKEAEKEGGTKRFKLDEIRALIDRYAGSGAFDAEYDKVVNGTPLFEAPQLEDCAELVFVKGVYSYEIQKNHQCAKWLD